MKKLEALFELIDKASGPAKKIMDSFKGVTDAGDKLGKAGSAGVDFLKDSFDTLKPAISAVGEVVGFAVDKLKYLAVVGAGLTIAAGHIAIEATEFKRRMLEVFRITEGSQEQAQATLDSIAAMADKAGVSAESLDDVYASLRRLGFASLDAKNIMAAMLDVKALGGDQAAEAFQKLFEKIQTSGEFKFEAREFLAAGITKEQVAKSLQGMDAYKSMTVAQIEAAMDAGKIKAVDGMNAILSAVNQTADQGKGLGTESMAITGQSLEGQIERLKNTFKDLLSSVDLSPLIDLIKQMDDALKSPEGQAMMKQLVDSFHELGPAFKEIFTPGNVHAIITLVGALFQMGKVFTGGVVKAIVGMFGPLRDVINLSDHDSSGWTKLAHGLQLIGEVIGFVVAAIAYGIGAIVFLLAGLFEIIYEIGAGIYDFFATTLPNWVSSGWEAVKGAFKAVIAWFEGLPDTFANIAQAIVDAITGKLTNGIQSVQVSGKKMGDALADAAKNSLQVHSPSKVFEDIGANVVAGLNIGVDKNIANDNAVGDLGATASSQPSVTSSAASVGGGGRQIIIQNVNITVQASPGMTAAQARDIGAAVAEGFRERLTDELERAAAEEGALKGAA